MTDDFIPPAPVARKKEVGEDWSGGLRGFDLPMPAGSTAKPPAAPFWNTEDVARTVAAKGTQGLLADVPGTPGDIGALERGIGSSAINTMINRTVPQAPVPQTTEPEGREVAIGIEREKQARRQLLEEAQRKLPGQYSLSSMLPGSDVIKAALGKILPFTTYEPQSEAGKIAGPAAELAGAAAPGGGGILGWAGRGASGFLSSLLGQTAEKNLATGRGEWAKPYVRPAAEILGMHFIPKVGPMIAPKEIALQQIADTRAADLEARANLPPEEAANRANVSMAMTPAEIEEAKRLGVDVNMLEAGGPRTRALMSEAAGRSPSAQAELDLYNQGLKPTGTGESPRISPAQDRVRSFVQNMTGSNLPIGDMTEANRIAQKADIDTLYDAARGNPNANAIVLDPHIANDSVVQTAANDVMKDIEKTKRIYGFENVDVIPPQAGTPQVRDPFTGELRGGSPATPGNLAFWDLVKRRMWSMGQEAVKGGKDVLKGEIDDSRRQLVSGLDAAVPEYGTARDKFAEMTGQGNAAMAGYDFGRAAGTTAYDSFDRAELSNAIKSYSPEQLKLAQHGYLTGIYEKIGQPNGLNQTANMFLRNKNFQNDARLMLGEEGYNTLRGKILHENFRTLASPVGYTPTSGFADIGRQGTFGAIAMGAVDALASALMSTQFIESLQSHANVIGGGAALGAIHGAMDAAKARRVASEVAPLLLSNDPQVQKRISMLADSDPAFQALMEVVSRSQPVMEQQRQGNLPFEQGGRVQRATGGRADTSAKAKADKLIAMVDQVRKSEGKGTSSLLNLDDTTVAKALAVANRGI